MWMLSETHIYPSRKSTRHPAMMFSNIDTCYIWTHTHLSQLQFVPKH